MPLSFVEAIAAASLQASGDTRTPLVIGGVGVVVKTALSALFIFGALGAPQLGVRGAAIGTAVSLALEGLLLAVALHSKSSALAIRARAARERALGLVGRARADLVALRRVLGISGPAFAEKVFYQVGYLGFTAVIGLLGEIAMAANQALVSIEAVCFLSADGFAIAAGALVAQKLGAGRPDEAKRAGLYATAMAIALLGAFGIVFAAAPRFLIEAFSPDPHVVGAGARALYVTALAQPFMATGVVLGMSLRGAGDTRTVLAVTLVAGLFVRVLASYFFAIVLDLGLVGIWMGSTSDWVTRTVLLGIAWARGGWRTTRV
jgi:putative MATE family efflux protein